MLLLPILTDLLIFSVSFPPQGEIMMKILVLLGCLLSLALALPVSGTMFSTS